METLANIRIDECGRDMPSLYPYICPEGKLTWLWGRNVEDRPITPDEQRMYKRLIELDMSPEAAFEEWANQLFLNDIWDTEQGLKNYISRTVWNKAPQEARIIAMNMGYNMGLDRFSPTHWPNFFRCFKEMDWAGCAVQMQWTDATKTKESKWYKQVDNHEDTFIGRSERLVKAMAALGGE